MDGAAADDGDGDNCNDSSGTVSGEFRTDNLQCAFGLDGDSSLVP